MSARALLQFLNAAEKRPYPYMQPFLKTVHLNVKVSKAQGPGILWYFELQFYTVFYFHMS